MWLRVWRVRFRQEMTSSRDRLPSVSVWGALAVVELYRSDCAQCLNGKFCVGHAEITRPDKDRIF